MLHVLLATPLTWTRSTEEQNNIDEEAGVEEATPPALTTSMLSHWQRANRKVIRPMKSCLSTFLRACTALRSRSTFERDSPLLLDKDLMEELDKGTFFFWE